MESNRSTGPMYTSSTSHLTAGLPYAVAPAGPSSYGMRVLTPTRAPAPCRQGRARARCSARTASSTRRSPTHRIRRGRATRSSPPTSPPRRKTASRPAAWGLIGRRVREEQILEDKAMHVFFFLQIIVSVAPRGTPRWRRKLVWHV